MANTCHIRDQAYNAREGSKKPILSEWFVQSCPERSRRKGRSPFGARSVRLVRERERREERQVCEPEGGKTATPGLASRSGKAREPHWRPFDQIQDRLFSTFPLN